MQDRSRLDLTSKPNLVMVTGTTWSCSPAVGNPSSCADHGAHSVAHQWRRGWHDRVGDAMTDRLLVDLGADGRVSVSTLFDGELSPNPAGESFKLAWPLDTDAPEDLRWYLEDYLRAPFGVYGERRTADRGPADRVGAGGVHRAVRRQPGAGRLRASPDGRGRGDHVPGLGACPARPAVGAAV